METQQLLVLVLVAAVVIAIAAWIIGSKMRDKRVARENVVRLATTLGLSMNQQGFLARIFMPKPLLSGTVDGRRFEFYKRQVQGGRNTRTTTLSILQVIPLSKSDLSFEFKMPDKSLTTKVHGKQVFNLSGLLDIVGQDVDIGDAAFDQAWKVSTSDPEFLKSALTPELRQKIMEMYEKGCHGTYGLNYGNLTYLEYGPFSDEQRWQRFAALAPVLGALAGIAEAHAKTKT